MDNRMEMGRKSVTSLISDNQQGAEAGFVRSCSPGSHCCSGDTYLCPGELILQPNSGRVIFRLSFPVFISDRTVAVEF